MPINRRRVGGVREMETRVPPSAEREQTLVLEAAAPPDRGRLGGGRGVPLASRARWRPEAAP